MNGLIFNVLKDSQQVVEIKNKKSELNISNICEEALLICTSYLNNPRQILIIKENSYQAQLLYSHMSNLSEAADLFIVEESMRIEAITTNKEQLATRVNILNALLNNQPRIIITHTHAIIKKLIDPIEFKNRSFSLCVDQIITINQLKNKCIDAGYQIVNRIDQPLCFATRGGIIDIFSINHENPIRIEFFDNEIESIRYFDISTQRTIETLKTVDIIVANEILLSTQQIDQIKIKANLMLEKKKSALNQSEYDFLHDNVMNQFEFMDKQIMDSSLYHYLALLDKSYNLFDYLNNADIIVSSKNKCDEVYKYFIDETVSYIQEMISENKMLSVFSIFDDYNKIMDSLKYSNIDYLLHHSLNLIREVSKFNQPINLLVDSLNELSKNNCIILSLKDSEIELITNEFNQKNIGYNILELAQQLENNIYLTNEIYSEGFEILDENILIYTSFECFNHSNKIKKYASKFAKAEALDSYQDLKLKDYVVHQSFGVGQYIQIITKEINGAKRDFMQVLFKGNDELLVPLEQFGLIRKFVSGDGVVPKLNKLGTNDWEKTKAKLKSSVNDIAERLVNLYANRENNIGYAYQKDNDYQLQFEKEFEYELTQDQISAVNDIKNDLQSDRPMDRLLCGDVGFGKTEVAVRASFKVVLESKQVAFLCPTTILSLQHFKTFKKRYENYPVRIEMLNRFVPLSKQKLIIEELKMGKIDIIIGTHRLLSKDIQYNDLGFLIIDEEQRFGVLHKEKIKEFKNSVDVLSLSATPIPRTLQMSLIGVRQCSLLNTPPINRLPVQTYVIEKDMNLIQNVIEKELARKGQVFYLYNNIEQIYNVARTIQDRIPTAKISVGHGRMNREEIEDVMLNFSNKDSDILICTTIIETGIDIPNANTIIIENADRFGLSQLYQIRGRVGRSSRVAYAYLMVPKFKQLTEIATKRLQTIKDFAQLGSGYKIAMRDLTIRGAGDILGGTQSGFINTVGIDYYIEVLHEAILEKQGIVKEVEVERVKPSLKVSGHIPKTFASNDNEKIDLYKKIDKISTHNELLMFNDEVLDNYGTLPSSVKLLFEKKRLELCINSTDIENFKELKNCNEIIFSKEFSSTIDGMKLFEKFSSISKDIRIVYKQNRLIVTIPKSKDSLKVSIEVILTAKDCIK